MLRPWGQEGLRTFLPYPVSGSADPESFGYRSSDQAVWLGTGCLDPTSSVTGAEPPPPSVLLYYLDFPTLPREIARRAKRACERAPFARERPGTRGGSA
jgi:hypothetical protein